MKKKILIILSVFILSLTLISCDKNTTQPNEKPDSSQTDNEKPSTPDSGDVNLTPDDSEKPTPNTSKKENRDVRLYFYDVVNDSIVYYNDTVEVTDKALTNALINALKNPSNDSVTPAVPSTIDVTSAKLDKENNLFTINFPSNFVSEMNLGSGPEAQTLQAIVNTLGYNFGVDNIIITLGGKPYSSGHIIKEVDESFKVSLDDTVKLN